MALMVTSIVFVLLVSVGRGNLTGVVVPEVTEGLVNSFVRFG